MKKDSMKKNVTVRRVVTFSTSDGGTAYVDPNRVDAIAQNNEDSDMTDIYLGGAVLVVDEDFIEVSVELAFDLDSCPCEWPEREGRVAT